MLLLPLVTLSLGAQGAEQMAIALRRVQPGNVFTTAQVVRIGVAGPPNLQYALTSYSGSTTAQGETVGGRELNLGRLACGYYTLEVRGGSTTVRAPVVVVEPPRRRRPDRLAVDAAISWLVAPERFEEAAELIRLAGFAWVRERIGWPEVEKERGRFDWGKYLASAEAYRKRGIQVCQVFHNVPSWSRADGSVSRYPDDLRDVYAFARAAARQFSGSVQAWEVWNESDISVFSVDDGSEYAAFLKAAALGLKAGDPRTQVAQVSLAFESRPHHRLFYRNGTQDYFDVFNYHIYDVPERYPRRARVHFDVLQAAAVPRKPVWLTEAGIALRAVDNTLTEADRRRQADFIPKSFAMSLAAGTDRHFFFIFPHYLENGIEFGATDADLLPYPGYAALATVCRLLGNANYLGQAELAATGPVQAHLFDSGRGHTLLVWAREGSPTLRIPSDPSLKAYNVVGEALPLSGEITVTTSPIYLVGPAGAFRAAPGALAQWRAPAPTRPKLPPVFSRIRLPGAEVNKKAEAFKVKAGGLQTVSVELYNFGQTARNVKCRISAPSGWLISPDTLDARVEPGDRVVQQLTLAVPERPDRTEGTLRLQADPPSASAELDLQLDFHTAIPSAALPLLDLAAGPWRGPASANGAITQLLTDSGEIRFTAEFNSPGDRWAYPECTLRIPTPEKWEGIVMEVSADTDDPSTLFRLQLAEQGGAVYFTDVGWPVTRAWRTIAVPFGEMVHAHFAPPDANGKLDLDQVDTLKIGINTPRDRMSVRVRNARIVRWRPVAR